MTSNQRAANHPKELDPERSLACELAHGRCGPANAGATHVRRDQQSVRTSHCQTSIALEPGQAHGSNTPLMLREVWSIRIRLQLRERLRDLAMFNLAIDSKLRGCDLVSLRVVDILLGGRVRPRAVVMQKKTGRPVQFEITEQTRETVLNGSGKAIVGLVNTCFRAGSGRTGPSPPGTTRLSWTNGLGRSAWIPHHVARTRYAGRGSP